MLFYYPSHLGRDTPKAPGTLSSSTWQRWAGSGLVPFVLTWLVRSATPTEQVTRAHRLLPSRPVVSACCPGPCEYWFSDVNSSTWALSIHWDCSGKTDWKWLSARTHSHLGSNKGQISRCSKALLHMGSDWPKSLLSLLTMGFWWFREVASAVLLSYFYHLLFVFSLFCAILAIFFHSFNNYLWSNYYMTAAERSPGYRWWTK